MIDSKKLLSIVLKNLKNLKSFSLIRIGDGEMIIINNIKDKMEFFCNKQINRSITPLELKQSQEWLEEAIKKATVLGKPTTSHLNKGVLWKTIDAYYSSLKLKNKLYSTINIHLDFLESGDLFKLFSKIDNIVIVSPRDIKNKLINKYNIKNVTWYSLPAEQTYEVEKNTTINIFDRIKEISKEIQSEDRSGQLLIFGAGPFGKILGTRFAEQGGVSLDLGCVFDLFVGKKTRGKGKGSKSFIKPYL